jgi:glycosyltransferase involved in cell wall biosynthesis
VLFLIRSLNYGGAQRQIVTLPKGLHRRGHDVTVVLFYTGHPLEAELQDAGVPMRSLDKQGRWDTFRFFMRWLRLLRSEKPQIVHGYLTEPNLLAVIVKWLVPRTKIVWGVRASNMDLTQYDWLARLVFGISCRLSPFADLIIANSRAGCEYHIDQGYPRGKMVLIPNGIDTDRFRPDRNGGRRIRREWNVPEEDKLIGVVGRVDPMKDHATFLRAAALLSRERNDVRFVCIGNGRAEYSESMRALGTSLGLADRLLWVESRDDVQTVFNALDIVVSSSRFGEGFGNVIAEAMACGVPCVVTDVGDSAWIVGDRGEVVLPNDPEALKKAIAKLLDHPKYSASEIREHIVSRASVSQLISSTERTLMDLVEGPAI